MFTKRTIILQQKFSSPLAIRLFKMYYELSLRADVCKIYGVDKFIYSTGLSVAPAYRGQKLAQRLLEVRYVQRLFFLLVAYRTSRER